MDGNDVQETVDGIEVQETVDGNEVQETGKLRYSCMTRYCIVFRMLL